MIYREDARGEGYRGRRATPGMPSARSRSPIAADRLAGHANGEGDGYRTVVYSDADKTPRTPQ
jgi:hypothetical protein